jgi:capsular exopolysaccharide synthesis family protein
MLDPIPSVPPRPATHAPAAQQPHAAAVAPHSTHGPNPPAPYVPDGEVHLLDRLAVLYRYRRISLAVFVLATAAIMIQGFTNTQVYQARAQLEIQDERSTAIPGLSNTETQYYEDPEPYYNTQYKILKGRDLTRKVIKKVHLADVAEFNGSAAKAPTPLTMIADLKNAAWNAIHPAPKTEQEAPKVDETPDESALVSAFISRVDVQPIRGSRLVDVFFTSSDPKFAASGANALVDEYVEQNLQLKLQSTQNMLDWLHKQLETQQQKVQESERQLAEYRDKQNAMSLDDKNNIVAARLNHLNDELIKAKTERIQKESLYNQVRSASAGASSDSIPAIAQNVQVQALKNRISELTAQKARLSERYDVKHPQILAVNSQLAEAQQQLQAETAKAVQALRNQYETAALTESTLARNLEAAKADATDLNRKSVDYNVMERESKSNRAVYEALLQKENELRVASNSRANNVRVIDHAEVPKGPVTPTGRRTWLMSIAVGLLLALGVAFGLDYMNDTIKTPEDVARRLKLPFLGLVPSVAGEKHPVLASSHAPHDFGEAFRSLRTAIMARYAGEGTKIMVVTSAQPLEGKTTTAANIAMALAYGGARVLIIDADMRRPGLHRPLRLTNERGLSQVLVGQARVRDVIQRTVDPNLLAMTAGATPPNPSELLASERMKTLLTNLSHGPFDWIVIDTPPVLAVTDAVILAPLVSGVTFVIGAEMTRRRLAERALETMMQTHPRLAAVVLNKVDFARNKYYYSRYYGHQYKNYYANAAV